MSHADLPIFKRLIPTLRKRYAELLPGGKYRLVTRDGAVFLVGYRSWADRMTVIHGLAERPQIEYFTHEIADRACDLFLDIGAHMGTYAIMVARRTNCRRIIAFEPDARNFAHLEANLLVNGLLNQVERQPLALSDSDGTVPFEHGTEHDVWSKVSTSDAAGSTLVACARLDSILAVSNQTIALKIDIEMHELQALEGMRRLLQNNRCFMQVECFPEYLPAFIAAMQSLGYERIHTIANDHYFARGL